MSRKTELEGLDRNHAGLHEADDYRPQGRPSPLSSAGAARRSRLSTISPTILHGNLSPAAQSLGHPRLRARWIGGPQVCTVLRIFGHV